MFTQTRKDIWKFPGAELCRTNPECQRQLRATLDLRKAGAQEGVLSSLEQTPEGLTCDFYLLKVHFFLKNSDPELPLTETSEFTGPSSISPRVFQCLILQEESANALTEDRGRLRFASCR